MLEMKLNRHLKHYFAGCLFSVSEKIFILFSVKVK